MATRRPSRATRFIRAAAARAEASGLTVECDSSLPTVAIDAPGCDGVFMQGDEAENFIAEAEALCKRYPSLEPSVAELALAEPYADILFH